MVCLPCTSRNEKNDWQVVSSNSFLSFSICSAILCRIPGCTAGFKMQLVSAGFGFSTAEVRWWEYSGTRYTLTSGRWIYCVHIYISLSILHSKAAGNHVTSFIKSLVFTLYRRTFVPPLEPFRQLIRPGAMSRRAVLRTNSGNKCPSPCCSTYNYKYEANVPKHIIKLRGITVWLWWQWRQFTS